MLFLLLGLLLPVTAFTFPVAAPPSITTHTANTPPTIDGAFDEGEWPGAPQITIGEGYSNVQYPSVLPVYPTYATFMSDADNLYIVVDVVGDKTEGLYDECLFVFPAPWKDEKASSLQTDSDDPVHVLMIRAGDPDTFDPNPGQRAVGFGPSPNSSTPHRIYEFSVPLGFLGAMGPGGQIVFCSPFFKGGFSMGYDSGTGHDNIWPPGLTFYGGGPHDYSLWATLQLGAAPADIPATSGAGLAILMMLLTCAALWAIVQRG